MTEIKRCDVVLVDGVPAHRPSESGRWVMYEDHAAIVAALQEQVRALAAEVSMVKEAVEQHANCFSVCQSCGREEPSETDDVVWMVRKIGTPATDAILREIRAQAIEALRDSISDIDNGIENTIDLHHYCTDFAFRIRTGEQP